MKKLSIAIPTYNSSIYLAELLERLSKFNSIYEVVISDDNSDIDQIKIINSLLKKYKKIFKITLSLNDKNIGGFQNKRKVTSLCSGNYIYQIDSDNLPSTKSLLKLSDLINTSEFNMNHLYLPSKLVTFKHGKKSSFLKPKNYVTFSKNSLVLTKSLIASNLKGEINSIKDKSIRWVLNTGNPLYEKENYLNKTAEISHNSKIAADAMALSYCWIKNNGEIILLKGFKHFHRLREDSYYVVQGADSTNSVNYYVENFKKL